MLKIELANKEFDNLPKPVSIFGVGCHSPLHAYDQVVHTLKKRGMGGTDRVFLLNYGDRELPRTAQQLVKKKRAFVVIVPGLSTLRNLAPVLQGTAAKAVVCEVPLLLNDVQGIPCLDYKAGTASYIFIPQRLTLQPLIRQLKRPEPFSIHLRTFDLIPRLIANVREGKVLDKFNTLSYCESNLQIRNDLQLAMIALLAGTLPITEFERMVREEFVAKRRLRTDTAAAYLRKLDELLEFVRSPVGDNYRTAYKEAHTRFVQGKTPEYSKLAEKHSVDIFELKYLVKLWIRLSGERFTLKPLHALGPADLNIQARKPKRLAPTPKAKKILQEAVA